MRLEFDPYSELGIASSASLEDIKAAYRRAARRLHPDQNRNSPGAAVQMQEITAAYEFLLDEANRRTFDTTRIEQQPEYVFQFRVTSSKRAVTRLNEPQVIYMLAEVIPDIRASEIQEQRDSRLNLTLVLDRSNSMNGVRLDKVKVAAHQIIDQLKDDDVFSVVVFNDRAEVIIPAGTVKDRSSLKARVSMMGAGGGTEIYEGLASGVEQTRKFLAPRLVNHIIMLTDGHTYGDQERTINLARASASEGIVISAMGLGQEWNDKFLDELAAATGGTSTYINSAGSVVRFLNDHVRGLSNVFAERVAVSVAPESDIKLESAFRLAPNPQPLVIDQGYIPLGNLQFNRTISVLFQFEMPAELALGFRPAARLSATGDIMANKQQKYKVINDMSLEVTEQSTNEEPPTTILEALAKLTLYHMQENAQAALERGDIQEATRRLENLATRLFELGEGELAQQAQAEAQQVAFTSSLTDKGRKTLKYQTRFLLSGPNKENDSE
jgi:Ca-activated chloride channel family protein